MPAVRVESDQSVPSGTPWVRFNTAAGRGGVVGAIGRHGAVAVGPGATMTRVDLYDDGFRVVGLVGLDTNPGHVDLMSTRRARPADALGPDPGPRLA